MVERNEQSGGDVHARYEHFRTLPRAGIEAHLEGLTAEAEHIMGQYAPGDTIRGEHGKRLAGCIGDLLPMLHNESVQAEIVKYGPDTDAETLLFNRLQGLNVGIMTFIGQLEDTGVQVFYNDESLD